MHAHFHQVQHHSATHTHARTSLHKSLRKLAWVYVWVHAFLRACVCVYVRWISDAQRTHANTECCARVMHEEHHKSDDVLAHFRVLCFMCACVFDENLTTVDRHVRWCCGVLMEIRSSTAGWFLTDIYNAECILIVDCAYVYAGIRFVLSTYRA